MPQTLVCWLRALLVVLPQLIQVVAAPAPAPPCPLRRGQPTAVVLGGDDAGTGAAWALASLGVDTLLVLTHRRDLGGDPASFYHDGGHMVRNGGGLNDLLLCSANSSCDASSSAESRGGNANIAGGPGAAFLFFDTLLRTKPLNQSLEILEGYIAMPKSGEVDQAGRIVGVTLLHRNGSTCFVRAKYAIDGTPEGYGAAAFSLPVIFGREALHNHSSDDPTTRAEPYAGRRSFSVNGHGAPVEVWSDRSVETQDVSSGVGPITNLCQWANESAEISENAPWLLKNPPAGYDPRHFAPPPPWAHSGKPQHFVDGNCCPRGPPPNGCEPEVFRYQGLGLSTLFAKHTGSTGPSLPGWYLLGDKQTHYLRRSYSNPAELWALKRSIEIKAFYWAVGGLWYIQNEIAGGKAWGFCKSSFPTSNPALEGEDASIPAGPYTLKDFNTSTYGGDITVAFRLYHRQVARLGSVSPVGAAQLYDGQPRVPSPLDAVQLGVGGFTQGGRNTKKYWEPASVVFPLYGTDYTKGVLGGTVILPSGCNGDCGDGVLMGNGPSDGNMHGMTRNLFTPDAAATRAAMTAGKYPPAGEFDRAFVENFLSPGTPRSTFMLQSSARIGCFASNIGIAAGTVIAWSERLGLQNTSAVPHMLIQWTLGANLSTAITYFEPALRSTLQPGGRLSPSTYAALHIAGAYAMPPQLDVGDAWAYDVMTADMNNWMVLYKEGVLTGRITPPSNIPNRPVRQQCLTNSSWFAYVPDWTVVTSSNVLQARQNPTFNCKSGALLKKCTGKSTNLPQKDVLCFRPGATLQLKQPPLPTTNKALLLVDPILPESDAASAFATRTQLASILNEILDGSAPCAIATSAISGLAGQKSFTLAELAHVVARHAMCARNTLHGERTLEVLGLRPYSFKGDR